MTAHEQAATDPAVVTVDINALPDLTGLSITDLDDPTRRADLTRARIDAYRVALTRAYYPDLADATDDHVLGQGANTVLLLTGLDTTNQFVRLWHSADLRDAMTSLIGLWHNHPDALIEYDTPSGDWPNPDMPTVEQILDDLQVSFGEADLDTVAPTGRPGVLRSLPTPDPAEVTARTTSVAFTTTAITITVTWHPTLADALAGTAGVTKATDTIRAYHPDDEELGIAPWLDPDSPDLTDA